jgi:prephenate dehydratase
MPDRHDRNGKAATTVELMWHQHRLVSAARIRHRIKAGETSPIAIEDTSTVTSRMQVVFQGEPGAFSEEAVLAFFGDGAAAPERTAVPTWRSVFEAVADGSADRGVVAIESSLAGSIRETYDLLAEFYDAGVRIVGEVNVRVRLALLALPGQTLDSIDRVYSHAQALAQADEFLRSRDWEVLTTYNTAGAARMIADRQETHAAAIASPRVAGLYGLEILAYDIQSGDENRTRFAILALVGDEAAPALLPSDGDSAPRRTTLVFAVQNVPGSLYRCLGTFAARGVNLSRLESRPARSARWEYVFWVDVDADPTEPACAAALDDLRAETEMVRILGSYPRAAED